MTIRNAAMAAVRWTTLAMLGRAAISLAQIVILSRILDPGDFKLVAIATTIVNVGIVFTDMGLNNAVIRFRDITSAELASLFWINIMLGGAVTLVVAAASPLIASFYGDDRLVPLVICASAVFIITAVGQQRRALAEKGLRFNILCGIDIFSALAAFAVAVGMGLRGFGASSIVVGNVAYAVCVSSICWLVLSDDVRLRPFSWAASRRFIAFGRHVVAMQTFNALAFNADIILGGRFIAGSALGYYFQPRDLCLRIMSVINPVVTRVSFPLLAAVAHDRDKVRSVYLKTLNMTSSINFPIYAFLALFSPELVEVVLGPRWTESAPILRVVAIWCALRAVGNPVGSLLLALGESRRVMACAAIVAAAVFTCVFIGSRFGIVGIPTALAILYAILIPCFWAWLVKPVCGVGFVEYHRVLALPGLATIVAVIPGIIMVDFNLVEAPLPRLFLGGVSGAAVYVASSWVINRIWFLSMTELLMFKRLGRELRVL